MSEPMKVKVEIEVQDIADAIIHTLTEDGTLVEVVRCKDCKWWGDYGCAIKIVDDSDKPKENDFCSFGERKDDETPDGRL